MDRNLKIIENANQAVSAFVSAWPYFVEECKAVLGSEQHYQALLYHCLRVCGVPRKQLGMNVKQYIAKPVTPHGQNISNKRHKKFKGIEPTPDAIIFHPNIKGDWRRRQRCQTLRYSLLSIEMKVSERENSRLRKGEIESDIEKLSALREEIREHTPYAPAANMAGLMIIVDTAPDKSERMTSWSLEKCIQIAHERNVLLAYVGREQIVAPFDEAHQSEYGTDQQ